MPKFPHTRTPKFLHTRTVGYLLKRLRERQRLETTPHLWKNDDYAATQTQPCPMKAEQSGDDDTEAAVAIADDSGIVRILRENDSEIADDQGDVSSQTLAAKRRSPAAKKLRSIVWDCFKKGEGDSGLAVCTICGITIRLTCSSTTNLLKHIMNKHPDDYEALVLNKFVMASPVQPPISIKSPSSSSSSQVTRRRSRSVMWKYFAKCAYDHSQVLCTFCGRVLKQRLGSTSNLVKHLFAVHRSEYKRLFPEGSHKKSEECIDNMTNETCEDGLFIGSKQADRNTLDETQMELSEEGRELNSSLCDLKEENKISNTETETMFVKLRPVWQKYCDESEREFNKFMNARQKEMEETSKSIQKLQQHFSFLVKEVEQHKSKRKAELRRQEEMEARLLEKEATLRKRKYRMSYLNTCNLLEDTINGGTSIAEQSNCIVNGFTDNSNSIEVVVSPNFVNGD